MLTIKKRLVAIIFIALFSAATIVSCGKQAKTDEETTEQADEHPTDSEEHPSDTTHNEHPADSTGNQ